MVEMILPANILPEPIFSLVRTEKVMIREFNDEIHLIPIKDLTKSKSILPILGMYTDGKLTVDGYLEQKRIDKELER